MKRVLCIRPDIADAWLLCHDRMPCHSVLSLRVKVNQSRYRPGGAQRVLGS